MGKGQKLGLGFR